MTLQNRLALDLLLAKEQGVCGYLKLDREHCCVHSPNVKDHEKQFNKMWQVAEDSNAIQKASETNWFNKILQGIGRWSLRGWLDEILETMIIILVTVEISDLAIGCVPKMINYNLVGMYATIDRNQAETYQMALRNMRNFKEGN